MQTTVTIVTPAEDFALMTTRDALLGLNLSTPTETLAAQIDLIIKWASDSIALKCLRPLAREELIETIWDLDSDRIYLERFPVKEIKGINENGTDLLASDYILENKTGKLMRVSGRTRKPWGSNVAIHYVGGYDLPKDAPGALSQACMMLTRDAYNAMQRGDSSIRMVSHKESRIMYFDPNAHLGKGAGVGSGTDRAVDDLCKRFIRFPV